jgi:hypothetical protein
MVHDDDAVLSRLNTPLAGAKRVDVVRTVTFAGKVERRRVEDVPFDEKSGDVLLTPSTSALRKMPNHTWHVQRLAVEAGAEKTNGEYTFEQSAA